jgi:hypothetical protein
VVHSHLRAGLALRCVTEGLGPDWTITKIDYRLRKPAYAPVTLAYSAEVVSIDGGTMTLRLLEDHPSGELGFEGAVVVTRAAGSTGEQA